MINLSEDEEFVEDLEEFSRDLLRAARAKFDLWVAVDSGDREGYTRQVEYLKLKEVCQNDVDIIVDNLFEKLQNNYIENLD